MATAGSGQTLERVAEAYFSDDHLSSPKAAIGDSPQTRTNGDVGLKNAIDPGSWILNAGSDGGGAHQGSHGGDPRVAACGTGPQLNCIEGWTAGCAVGGARFSDFSAKYMPQFRDFKYVGMETPDGGVLRPDWTLPAQCIRRPCFVTK